jgi:hypothetical protein
LQPLRSRASAAGNSQTARIARSRKRALTPKLYTRRSREDGGVLSGVGV